MAIEMLHDKLLIKRIEVEQKSEGGIILGQEVEEERETVFGRVLEVGPGKQVDGTGIIPTRCQRGDIVSFSARMPRRIVYKGEELHIIRESEIDARYIDEDLVEVRYEVSAKPEKGVTILN